MSGVAASLGYLYFRQMSILPKKPQFPEVKKTAVVTAESSAANSANPQEDISVEAAKPEKETQPEAETKPEKETQPEKETKPEKETQPEAEPLPPNAYKAKVTWPQGLNLRAEPSLNGASVSGIAYNSTVIVLEETADKKWQKVRIPWSGQEGWVRNGNTEQISY